MYAPFGWCCWALTSDREHLEMFLAPTRGIKLLQPSRDVLPHLELVLRQLHPYFNVIKAYFLVYIFSCCCAILTHKSNAIKFRFLW